MTFDVDKEAIKIEHMAKERIDTPDDKAGAATQALINEWNSLTQAQRNVVAVILSSKYEFSSDAMPSPNVEYNMDGNVSGLYFTASKIDFHKGPHTLDLTTEKSHNGQQITELKADTKISDQVHQEAQKIYDLANKKLHTNYKDDNLVDTELLKEWRASSAVQTEMMFALQDVSEANSSHIKVNIQSDSKDNFTGVVFDNDIAASSPKKPDTFGMGTVNFDYQSVDVITAGQRGIRLPEDFIGLNDTDSQQFSKAVLSGKVRLNF